MIDCRVPCCFTLREAVFVLRSDSAHPSLLLNFMQSLIRNHDLEDSYQRRAPAALQKRAKCLCSAS